MKRKPDKTTRQKRVVAPVVQHTAEELEAKKQSLIGLRTVGDDLRRDLSFVIGRFLASNTPHKEMVVEGQAMAQVPLRILRAAIMACVEMAVVMNAMDPDPKSNRAVDQLVSIIPVFGPVALEETIQQIAAGIESCDIEDPIPTTETTGTTGGFGNNG